MASRFSLAAGLCALSVAQYLPAGAATPDDPGGVLKQLTIAAFAGSGQTAITAVAAGPDGGVYVAGTTTAPDLPVQNAAMPAIGESRIMRSDDKGATWTRMGSPPTDLNVLVSDPTALDVLFAAGGAGIYKTRDGGARWKLVYAFPQNFGGLPSLTIDPGNPMRLAAMAPGTEGLLRSVDGGETWGKGGLACPLSSCSGSVYADPAGSGALLVLAAGAYGLSISFDWGATFTRIGPVECCGPSAAALDPSHPGWIYLGMQRGASGSLWLSTDFGQTWSRKTPPPTTFSAPLNITVDPDRPNTLLLAAADGLYLSVDGASSWVKQGSPQAAFFPSTSDAMVLLPGRCGGSGGLFALGGFHRVAYSPDYGATWQAPQQSSVTGIAAGPGCSVYLTRQLTTDVFVSRLAPDGAVLWTTFLGGSEADAPAGIAVDSRGNAYVAGSTNSTDFPTTAMHIGVPGTNSGFRAEARVFLSKFSAGGNLLASVTLGGEGVNLATALAIDAGQSAYVVGYTSSTRFPTTPGAAVTVLATGATGFLVKLAADLSLNYATYFGEVRAGQPSNLPTAVLATSAGEAIVAGAGFIPGLPPSGELREYVARFDHSGSSILSAAYIGGAVVPTGRVLASISLATDSEGDLYVAGVTAGSFVPTEGAYNSPIRSSECGAVPIDAVSPADVFVTRLRAADWQPVYAALLAGQCATQPGAMLVDNSGAVILALASGAGLDLRNPLLAGPACRFSSSALARLSPDGSTLTFGTYLDDCAIPAIAPAGDGSIYAGVTRGASAGVLRLSIADPPSFTLDRIANAFSGDAAAVVPGGLYSLSVSGLDAEAVDLGLNAAQALPAELAGARVTVDGVPAPLLQTSRGRAIVFMPKLGADFASVQISYRDAASSAVLMPVARSLPGLLTRSFPNPQWGLSDGNVRNEDGTLNDAAHPAAPGSTVTVFATGLGETNPPLDPGSIAQSLAGAPITPVYSTWNHSTPDAEAVYALPGFITALSQIPLKVPQDILNFVPNTRLPDGVAQVPVGLLLISRAFRYYYPLSNQVIVYVR